MNYSIAYNNDFASISDKKYCLRVYNRNYLEFIYDNKMVCVRFVNLPTSLIVIKKFKSDFLRLASNLLKKICIPELVDITYKIENSSISL